MERSKMAWMRTSAPGWPLVSSPPIFQRTGCPVEIGRLNEEPPTFRVFSRNPREHIIVEIVENGLVVRSRIRQSSVGERSCGGKTFLIGAATINITFVQSEMGVRG
jgi:hypothetical protein